MFCGTGRWSEGPSSCSSCSSESESSSSESSSSVLVGCSGEFKEISPGPKSRYWVNSIGEGALDRENTRAVYRSLGVRGRLSVCRNVLVLCSDRLDGSLEVWLSGTRDTGGVANCWLVLEDASVV